MRIEKILSSTEFLSICNDSVERGYYRNDKRILVPGLAWEMDWIYDPTGERQRANKHVMIKSQDAGNANFLSVYYWKDWSRIRPPICVVCPDGSLFEIDRRSKNGPGWKVTGDRLYITCHPSIVVSNYHGYLINGQFTPDLEGRNYNNTTYIQGVIT